MKEQYFFNINFESVHDFFIFLDLDGTLVADGSLDVSNETLERINKLKSNNKVYITSNNRDTDRIKEVSQKTGMDFLDNNFKKPSKKILGLLSEEERKMKKMVIGDKYATDGLFALRIGAEFIKTKNIMSQEDRWFIKYSYYFDCLVGFFLKPFVRSYDVDGSTPERKD